jgi:hypothetical protein
VLGKPACRFLEHRASSSVRIRLAQSPPAQPTMTGTARASNLSARPKLRRELACPSGTGQGWRRVGKPRAQGSPSAEEYWSLLSEPCSRGLQRDPIIAII